VAPVLVPGDRSRPLTVRPPGGAKIIAPPGNHGSRLPARVVAAPGRCALPDDLVGQVRDAGRVDDPDELQAGRARFQAVEQADAAAKDDGH
jgi:hypothetical protein